MISLDVSPSSEPLEALHPQLLPSIPTTENIPFVHSHTSKTERTPIFNLTNPEHDRLHPIIGLERNSREHLIQPHKQIRDLTPILTVNDHFLEWAQEERQIRQKSIESSSSLSNVIIEENDQPINLQKEYQQRDQLIRDYQEFMSEKESIPYDPKPGVIEEIVYIHGQPVVTRMAPEIAQPVIPVIQTHGPLPQVFLSSGNIQQLTAPKRPIQSTSQSTSAATSGQPSTSTNVPAESKSPEPAILKSGWLDFKRKQFFRSKWIHRYFILKSDGNLYQYKHQTKDQGDYELVHVLLGHCKVQLISKDHGAFDLINPKHVYHFKTSEDVSSWVDALHNMEGTWQS